MKEPRMKEVKTDIRSDIRKKWHGLVSEYDRRQIKCAEFCKTHKVSRSSIYKWRKYFSDNEGVAAVKSQDLKEIASTSCRSRKGTPYTNLQDGVGFIPLRIESESGNKKIEAVVSKYSKKISDNQISKINSPVRISKNSGITIEFADGCTIQELGKIIEVINAA